MAQSSAEGILRMILAPDPAMPGFRSQTLDVWETGSEQPAGAAPQNMTKRLAEDLLTVLQRQAIGRPGDNLCECVLDGAPHDRIAQYTVLGVAICSLKRLEQLASNGYGGRDLAKATPIGHPHLLMNVVTVAEWAIFTKQRVE
jgi:hypothetical protein